MKIILGYVAVGSRRLMITDPIYLARFDDTAKDGDNRGKYFVKGCDIPASLEVDNYMGQLGYQFEGVCFNISNGLHPVYAELDEDNKLTKVFIDFVNTHLVGEINEQV